MKNEIKEAKAHLKTLLRFQEHLIDQGHTFWHCDAVDKEKGMPFYYYQRNRSVSMSTCSVCQSLMENRKLIRSLQKKLGMDQIPLISNIKEKEHVVRVSTGAGLFNPNFQYIKAHSYE